MPRPDADLDAAAIERIARAMHEAYLRARVAEGATLGLAPLVSWDELPEAYRAQNRDSAADLPVKLAAIGLTLVPSAEGDGSGISPAELENLAELEHERWLRSHARGGGPGQARPASERPYDELDEDDKRKDREAVLSALAAADAEGWELRRG